MTDTTWRILRWSHALGRGEVVSGDSMRRLEFDATVATVDDFTPGEVVNVEFSSTGVTTTIVQVSPIQRRRPVEKLPPGLVHSVEMANTRIIRGALRQLQVWSASEDELPLRVEAGRAPMMDTWVTMVARLFTVTHGAHIRARLD